MDEHGGMKDVKQTRREKGTTRVHVHAPNFIQLKKRVTNIQTGSDVINNLLLDLWHLNINDLFHRGVFGCDTRGSTMTRFRTVSMVLNKIRGTRAWHINDHKQERQCSREREHEQLRMDNGRWPMENKHRAHRDTVLDGHRDNQEQMGQRIFTIGDDIVNIIAW